MAMPSGPRRAARAKVGTLMRPPKTAELIAGDLRRQIVRGQLEAGETLPPEMQLMEQYGVSRPTLREAFRILETETLITVRRGARGGAQVMEPDISVAARYVGLLLQIQGTTVQDVYEARAVSEPQCTRLLAMRRTERDVADLRLGVEDLRGVVDPRPDAVPDDEGWARATSRFEGLLLDRCGNETLAVQGVVLQEIVATHLHKTVVEGLGGAGSSAQLRAQVSSYAELVDLVEAGDADGAEAHWRRHLEAAAEYLLARDRRNTPVVELFG